MRAPEPGAGWTPARQRGVNGRGPLHSERLWQSRGGPLRGQEEALPLHRPNAGYVIGKETVAWARGSGRDAPKPDPHHRRIGSYATSPSAGSISTISTDLTSSVSPE